MAMVTIRQAKRQLSKLISQALRGEEVIIANESMPMVRLTPVAPFRRRQFGSLKGVVLLDESFSEPLPPEEFAG